MKCLGIEIDMTEEEVKVNPGKAGDMVWHKIWGDFRDKMIVDAFGKKELSKNDFKMIEEDVFKYRLSHS